MALMQQNIIAFWTGKDFKRILKEYSSLKGSTLTSQKLTILIQKLNH